jgi:hypothetical protein
MLSINSPMAISGYGSRVVHETCNEREYAVVSNSKDS